MEGHCAISDLSDPIRPQKVSEMFNELYDNQWTEAFEWLVSQAKTADDRSDRVVTKQLLDILMDCHKYCSREAEAQRKSIMTALTFDSGNQADQATMLAQDTRRKLSDFIKSVAPELVSFLKRKYSSKVINTAFRNYQDRCLECCWYACIQTPPLHLSTDFTLFDDDCHRGYQTPGDLVDYVVWPAIYIERNGALLSKAVVESCNEKKSAQDENAVTVDKMSLPKQELNNNTSAAPSLSSENDVERKHVARIQIGSNGSGTEPTVTISNNASSSNSTYGRQFSLTAEDLESKKSELRETKTFEAKPESRQEKKELANLLDRSLSSQEPMLQRTPSAVLDVSAEELEDRKSTLKETKTPDTRQQPKEIGSFNFG